jgi:hypothetical protein
MQAAGTSQFVRDGKNNAKNSKNFNDPLCQTMSVVMSPKGLKAPPALAATTMLMQARQRMPGSLGPWSTPRRPNRLEACWRRLAQRQLVAEPLLRGDVHPLFAVTAGSVYEWIRRF